jgi:hypothetical protein
MRALRDAPQELTMHWTPNRVTALRVVVGFSAVCLFGRGPWMNLTAVALTVASVALDALDGHIARRRNLATPVGAPGRSSSGERIVRAKPAPPQKRNASIASVVK